MKRIVGLNGGFQEVPETALEWLEQILNETDTSLVHLRNELSYVNQRIATEERTAVFVKENINLLKRAANSDYPGLKPDSFVSLKKPVNGYESGFFIRTLKAGCCLIGTTD